MSNVLTGLVVIGAAVTTGMTAGLLYAFAHSVMPGLGTLDDAGFLTAFQRVDVAVENGWMLLGFLGSPVLTVLALALRLGDGGPVLWWLVVALALVVATLAITGAVHLPLNRAVQAAAPQFTDAPALRARFERRWTTWNVVRTVTSAGSFVALCGALLLSGQPAG